MAVFNSLSSSVSSGKNGSTPVTASETERPELFSESTFSSGNSIYSCMGINGDDIPFQQTLPCRFDLAPVNPTDIPCHQDPLLSERTQYQASKMEINDKE